MKESGKPPFWQWPPPARRHADAGHRPGRTGIRLEEPTLFKGLEGLPEQMIDPRALRRAYQAEFDAFLRQVRSACRTLSIDHVLLRTDKPLDVPLTGFLTRRMQRAGRT